MPEGRELHLLTDPDQSGGETLDHGEPPGCAGDREAGGGAEGAEQGQRVGYHQTGPARRAGVSRRIQTDTD